MHKPQTVEDLKECMALQFHPTKMCVMFSTVFVLTGQIV